MLAIKKAYARTFDKNVPIFTPASNSLKEFETTKSDVANGKHKFPPVSDLSDTEDILKPK